jgi:prevent-host-death family protein
VKTIPQKELRNHVGEVLRQAEAGEEFTVTVSGRPVAHLGPARKRQWVAAEGLGGIWETPAPESLGDDLAKLPAALADPFS